MSQQSNPFTPNTTGTVSRTVSGTSARVALATLGSGSLDQTVMVTSDSGVASAAIAFIEFGDVTVAAVAATGTPILPGAVLILTPPAAATHVAAIGTAGTLYFTSGRGA